MHLVRNAIDHGIESPEEDCFRKSESGTLLLEAKNSGSDVLIIVKDDGRGLNKERSYQSQESEPYSQPRQK